MGEEFFAVAAGGLGGKAPPAFGVVGVGVFSDVDWDAYKKKEEINEIKKGGIGEKKR